MHPVRASVGPEGHKEMCVKSHCLHEDIALCQNGTGKVGGVSEPSAG